MEARKSDVKLFTNPAKLDEPSNRLFTLRTSTPASRLSRLRAVTNTNLSVNISLATPFKFPVPLTRINFGFNAAIAAIATCATEARADDGTVRDVTSFTVYEPANTAVKVSHDGLVTRDGPVETTILVRYLNQHVPVLLAFIPARPDFAWHKTPANNFINDHVFRKLKTLRMNASVLCTDNEFVRRASLDPLGLLPTADETRAFAADVAPNVRRGTSSPAPPSASSRRRLQEKRARLVDTLLERPEFAEFWALKWSDVLRNEEKVLDRKGVQAYSNWIRQSLAENKPHDQFVRELVSARGSTYQNPPANFYRANRDAVTRSEATAQLFLGTRLQCAKCHNHPFDRWTQTDYYDWADVFARIDYKVLANNRSDGLDKHEFNGEQVVYLAREGNVTNPRTDKPAIPRFLGEPAKPTTGNNQLETDQLAALAQWLTAQPNFARSQVNWVWFQLLGRASWIPSTTSGPPTRPVTLPSSRNSRATSRRQVRSAPPHRAHHDLAQLSALLRAHARQFRRHDQLLPRPPAPPLCRATPRHPAPSHRRTREVQRLPCRTSRRATSRRLSRPAK